MASRVSRDLFSEPAGLAFYLAGLCFCCLWLTRRGCRVMNPSLLLMLAIMAMLISISTAGIATVAVGLPIVLLLAGLGADTRAVGHLAKTVFILALSSTIAFAPVLPILKPSILTSVNNVVTSTLTKRDSKFVCSAHGARCGCVGHRRTYLWSRGRLGQFSHIEPDPWSTGQCRGVWHRCGALAAG